MKFFDRFRKKREAEKFSTSTPKHAVMTKPEVKPAVAESESSSVSAPAFSKSTGEAYRILLRPLATEKNSYLAALNQHVFAVSPEANKTAVRHAIEQVYGVKVKAVNIMNYQGKEVFYGRYPGRRHDWRKAIVTLEKGQRLELYSKV